MGDGNDIGYEAVLHKDGKVEIFRTDDEGEYLRFCLEQYLLDYKVAAEVKVEPLEDRWFRIEVTFLPAGDAAFKSDVYDDLSNAFTGKGWYEHRKSGGSDDGSVLWFEVRHDRGGPVI